MPDEKATGNMVENFLTIIGNIEILKAGGRLTKPLGREHYVDKPLIIINISAVHRTVRNLKW
jgi:hypothetical protein